MKNIQEIIIMGKFDNLNKLISATNHNRYIGANIKKRNTLMVKKQVEGQQLLPKRGNYEFHWHLSDKRQDPDNIASAHKYIFDGFQEAGILPNDNWEYIHSLHDYFYNDAMKGFEYVLIRIWGEEDE